MPKKFNRQQVASMALESMMDRIDTSMPDIGDNFPKLAKDPLSVKYVHGCIETAVALIQSLTGWFMDDIYSTTEVEAEIKALYPYRLKRHKALVAQKPPPADATLSLPAIIDRMMDRLVTAGAFNQMGM